MCGICGVVYHDRRPIAPELVQNMNDMIVHRGPDGEGMFRTDGAALAMRRLSIIDVAGSDQPLYNEDKRIAVVFNGEIFNYLDLRADLTARGHRFHTQGDGETIAHLYEDYGDGVPEYLRGQFAFSLWDEDKRRLLLARDRMGQKPLYYYYDEQVFVWGSEIKAILAHPDVPRESALDDPQMLALYLGYGYVPAPMTAFKHIKMLPPGHLLVLDDGKMVVRSYWELPPISPYELPAGASESHYIGMVREVLEEAVKLRLVADVPLGAFLSGGLDSSLIVALMRKHSNAAVKTFSIGFDGDDSFDETPYANQVAELLETEHTAFHVKPDALELLAGLVWHYDQPFADSSAIPTYLVSKLTREHVTVALTGDGGDELFAGYERFYAASLLQRFDMIPRPLWKLAAAVLGLLPEGTGYYNRIKRAGRFARGASKPLSLAYFDWVRLFDAGMVSDLLSQADFAGKHFNNLTGQNVSMAGIVQANMASYLPDDLLIKADRCTMAASLEGRAPFMDHRLVEIVAPMPFNLKLRGNTTKYILKEAARGLLPDSIIDRQKHGFGVPLGTWLRHDSSVVREILLSREARDRGLFDMDSVARLITAHESGQRDHGQRLWTLLTLEWWHRLFIDVVPDRSAGFVVTGAAQ